MNGLELVNDSIQLPASPLFLVEREFTNGKAGIWDVGSLGPLARRVEDSVPAGTLTSYRLNSRLRDPEILEALKARGHQQTESYMAWIFSMIQAQAARQEGNLLINHYTNLFFLFDRSIRVYWAGTSGSYGWYVRLTRTARSRKRAVDSRVFVPSL